MKLLFVAAIVCCAIILAESSYEKNQYEEKLVYHVKSRDDFDQQLHDAGNKLIVINFSATWCSACKNIAHSFEDLAAYFENVVFLKVDVDECDDLAMFYNISRMPTFIFMQVEGIFDEFSGANAEKLDEYITYYTEYMENKP